MQARCLRTSYYRTVEKMMMIEKSDLHHLRRALDLAREHSQAGINGPFGAVIVLNGEILGEGWNRVVELSDPTAHAEMLALRQACARRGSPWLEGAVLYANCEPCPMCLAAAYWARIERIVHAATREDAAAIGFDDRFIYEEFAKELKERSVEVVQALPEEGRAVFDEWAKNPKRVMY